MTTLTSAPIGVPPSASSLWQRLKGLFTRPALAVSNADLEATVLVLETKVKSLEALTRQAPAPAPAAVLPTDVYIAGRRHTAEGVMYTTTTVNATTDRFIAGSRVSDTGEQVISS